MLLIQAGSKSLKDDMSMVTMLLAGVQGTPAGRRDKDELKASNMWESCIVRVEMKGAMPMKRLVGLHVVCLIVLMVGFGVAAEEIYLTFTAWGGLSHQLAYQDLAQAFSDQHPNIFIEFVPDTGGYVDKMKASVLANTGPDIYFTQEMQTVGFIDEGWLISLNEYIANSPELISQIHEPLFNSFTWKGVIGSLPVVTFVSMFYYNPVLFQEAGLPLPESISWDDLVNLGKVLTKKSSDGHVIQYGHRVEYEPNFCLYYLWQNGGGILDESCRNSILNTDATRGAVDFIYDLAWLHEIIPKPWEMGEYLLELGNLAMYTHGSWMTGYYDELFGFNDFDALPVPIGKYEVSMAYPNGFGISAASPHPDEAWEFLKFASGPEGQRILAAAGLGIPINSDPSVAAVYLEGRTMKQRRAALEAVTTAQAPRVVPGMQDDIIARYVWPLLDQVWTNQRPVTQVLQELDRLVQQYLDQVYAR